MNGVYIILKKQDHHTKEEKKPAALKEKTLSTDFMPIYKLQ